MAAFFYTRLKLHQALLQELTLKPTTQGKGPPIKAA